MLGKRFGRLAVVSQVAHQGHHRRYRCVCECGEVTLVLGFNLRNGRTVSCGCAASDHLTALNKSRRKHGYSPKHGCRPITYSRWIAMRQRVATDIPKYARSYKDRGIRVCRRWDEFSNFLADMGECPGPGWTLDRMNPNGHYEPTNVRWATVSENSRTNKRRCWCPHCEYHQRLQAVEPLVE